MYRIVFYTFLFVSPLLCGCGHTSNTGFDLQFRNLSGADLDHVALQSDDGEIGVGILSDKISAVHYVDAPLLGNLTVTWKDEDNNRHALPLKLPAETYTGRAVIINFLAGSKVEVVVEEEVIVD